MDLILFGIFFPTTCFKPANDKRRLLDAHCTALIHAGGIPLHAFYETPYCFLLVECPCVATGGKKILIKEKS